MTPAARVSAAIDILDDWLAGRPVEAAILSWSRRSRFAGSKDRAAVRDLVFDAVRCKRSFAALGGALTGRGLMLGAIRAAKEDESAIFSGNRFAPPPVMPEEHGHAPAPGAQAHDLPDWLWAAFQDSLGADASQAALKLQGRAPVFLRVNRRATSRENARIALRESRIETRETDGLDTGLEVTSGARYLRMAAPVLDGRVEFQDASSQAAIQDLPLSDGMRVLDYCAGGGGKALAMAALWDLELVLHDAKAARMQDVARRADRAGVRLETVSSQNLERQGLFDLVLCDAPCSGSGAWRRSPEEKWRLTPARLQALAQTQTAILHKALSYLRPGGWLVYLTCSVLTAENEEVVAGFTQSESRVAVVSSRRWPISDQGDGFFRTVFRSQ